MRPANFLSALLLLPAFSLQAQKITGVIKNAASEGIQFHYPGVVSGYKADEVPVSNSTFSYQPQLKQPEMVNAYAELVKDGKKINWAHSFFLSPGDELKVTLRLEQDSVITSVTGKGSVNNQPLALSSWNMQPSALFKPDTLPDRILPWVQDIYHHDSIAVEAYIRQYKPGPLFSTTLRAQIAYRVMDIYYNFMQQKKYGATAAAYQRTRPQWYAALHTLAARSPLQNEQALLAPSYIRLLYNYMLREREEAWTLLRTQPAVFFKEWFGKDEQEGKTMLGEDLFNLITQHIIENTFAGKARERAYAIYFEDALKNDYLVHLFEVYDDFTRQFPKSTYRPVFDKEIKDMQNRLAGTNAVKAVFLDTTGAKFTTPEEMVSSLKGKVIFIDMWGTWCIPCRNDLKAHSASIKAPFKDNPGIAFLYVANFDLKNTKNWKDLIGFYHLDGYHVLAGEALTAAIMKKVKGQGYPTYIVVDKTGNFKLANSPYPIDPEVVISELKAAL